MNLHKVAIPKMKMPGEPVRTLSVLLACGILSPLPVQAQQGGWTSIGPRPAGVEAPIVADPAGMGPAFIGSYGGGIRKTTDNGRTWTAANRGLTSMLVTSLAMDASGSQTLYAGTISGVFKTADGGATWGLVASGLIDNLATDPNRPGVVYAGLLGGTISKTADGGASWKTVFSWTSAVYSFAIAYDNSDIVYAATLGGAFKSTDAGENWSPMPGLTPAAVWTLAIDPADSRASAARSV